MIRRPLALTLLLTTLLVLGTTAVLAKEGAIATLDDALPTDPQPGSEITVGWTVEMPGMNGEPEPFNAEAVFIRVIPVTGEPVEVVGQQGPNGHYVATATVPAGGIRNVEIGLRGESCSGGTCQRSDLMFTIADVEPAVDPGAAVYNPVVDAPEAAPADAAAPVSGSNSLALVAVIALALAAAAIVLGTLFLRGRGRMLTPGSSRS